MLLTGGALATVDAVSGCVFFVASARSDARDPAVRFIDPSPPEVRGRGSYRRSVVTYVEPPVCHSLAVGHTIVRDGGWSTYPPHKHDRDRPPHETAAPEVLSFDFNPPGGFGLVMRYVSDVTEAQVQVVRDADTIWIRSGYHSVVAAGGYGMHYVWAAHTAGAGLRHATDRAFQWLG
jgi:5-deoxy-glucuronate isomerase